MTESARPSRILSSLAASLCAACGATLALGLDAGLDFGVLDMLAIAGLVALASVPAMFVLSLGGRYLVGRWRRTGPLAPSTVAAWLIVSFLAVAAYAYALFRGTWQLAAWTQFKPNVIGLAVPVIAVGAAVIVGLAAGPTARGLAHVLERREIRRATPLRLRTVIVVMAALSVASLVIVWRIVLVPRLYPGLLERDSLLGPSGRLVAPLCALAILVAVPALWRRVAVRIAGGVMAATVIACIVAALVTVRSRANTALMIWAEQPLASAVIERAFSLADIRADLPATLAPVARPGAEHRDLAIVVVDGLRVDRIPPRRPAASASQLPALRALARRAAFASAMYASSSSPSLATAAMVIGTGADRIRGARSPHGELRSLDPRHVLLSERMRAGGYTTAAFVCCPHLYGDEAPLGLARGFDRVEGAPSSTELAKRAAAFLAAPPTGSPRMAWLHLNAPATWMAYEPATDHPYDAYEVTLAEIDRAVAALVAGIAEIPPDRTPLLVIVGTHGESLGERGARGHGTDLSDPQLRVPFIVAGPGITSTEITNPTSAVDVVPTVLELAGFVAPRGPRIDGQSLAPQVRASSTLSSTLPLSRVVTAHLFAEPPRSTIVDGTWKLVETGEQAELYDLHSDATERYQRTREHPDIVARLRARLGARRATARLEPF